VKQRPLPHCVHGIDTVLQGELRFSGKLLFNAFEDNSRRFSFIGQAIAAGGLAATSALAKIGAPQMVVDIEFAGHALFFYSGLAAMSLIKKPVQR
jgi:hypothetical protein